MRLSMSFPLPPSTNRGVVLVDHDALGAAEVLEPHALSLMPVSSMIDLPPVRMAMSSNMGRHWSSGFGMTRTLLTPIARRSRFGS